MKEAVEDHRASAKAPPRSIYGCIIAEADRDLRPEIILQRTWLYGLKYAPNLNRAQQVERLYNHMLEKYAEGGYMKLWLNARKNMEGLTRLREMIADKERLWAYVLAHADEWEAQAAPERT